MFKDKLQKAWRAIALQNSLAAQKQNPKKWLDSFFTVVYMSKLI